MWSCGQHRRLTSPARDIFCNSKYSFKNSPPIVRSSPPRLLMSLVQIFHHHRISFFRNLLLLHKSRAIQSKKRGDFKCKKRIFSPILQIMYKRGQKASTRKQNEHIVEEISRCLRSFVIRSTVMAVVRILLRPLIKAAFVAWRSVASRTPLKTKMNIASGVTRTHNSRATCSSPSVCGVFHQSVAALFSLSYNQPTSCPHLVRT